MFEGSLEATEKDKLDAALSLKIFLDTCRRDHNI